jgi:hypothetical protein
LEKGNLARLRNIIDAQVSLAKAGVFFDSGYSYADNVFYFEMDWVLVGANIRTVKFHRNMKSGRRNLDNYINQVVGLKETIETNWDD